MFKAQATTREIGLAALLMIALAIYLYVTGPRSILLTWQQPSELCNLHGNLSCNTVFLKRESSKIDVSIEQDTGYLINITSVVCTSNTTAPVVMPLLNNSILITNGQFLFVAGGNSGNEVVCTGQDGRSIPNASVGNVFYGNLYIDYTEVKTGIRRFVNGTLVTKYS